MVIGEYPGVSVVIPTVGRSELARAVASVRQQDYPGPIELIIVGDLPEGTLERAAVQEAAVTLYTGGAKRGGAARNLGVEAASQPFVAFLDDDDEWHPGKLSTQMRAFDQLGADVVGTRSVYRNSKTGTTSSPAPTRVLSNDQTIAEYLFRRRSPSAGRPVLYTSTLAARSELAKRVPWDPALERHQDWDWIDRLQRAGAKIVQIPDATAVIWTGSEGSISSRADWRSSLEWAETRRGVWTAGVLSDFFAGQTLRYAIQARSFVGTARVLRAITRTGRFPSAQTVLLGLGGLVPRTLINRLLSK